MARHSEVGCDRRELDEQGFGLGEKSRLHDDPREAGSQDGHRFTERVRIVEAQPTRGGARVSHLGRGSLPPPPTRHSSAQLYELEPSEAAHEPSYRASTGSSAVDPRVAGSTGFCRRGR